jgi:phospholipid/cholesterol/gamma-HCH transport system permease protein
LNPAIKFIASIGSATINLRDKGALFLTHIAHMGELAWLVSARSHLMYKNFNLSLNQMYIIGVQSLPLVSVIALFLGAQTVMQAVYQFAGIVPLRYLGLAVCKTMIVELGPVVTSMVVSGRVATAIAAEIGSMNASDQLDAMTCLSLDPIRYLIVPKTIACMIMLPVLVIYAELLAFVSSIITVIVSVDVTLFVYLSGLRLLFNPADLLVGIAKTTVFGAIISIVGSHFGFKASGGAEGVGDATTKAVMTSFVLILIFDFFIAFMVL